MTEGERMVWAATYAVYYLSDCEKEEAYGKRWKRSVPTAIEWAWAAVKEMREARPAVLEGWGEHELLDMLDEMLKDGSP